ncbi:hypothetical protein [Hwangdonia lutea]|uniref:Uncharacterized protein n=1 Tax=Hwangdonia lutea TaxID=3075823 RepID=A0AA97EKY7_9FLAO|nr:hypothetical protein [Hwangdonia sp. SCSIO 19198]WOD43137.1 hypothetical protein RNZ46_14185 [Hwangdonia sp. SCSIO 19198]
MKIKKTHSIILSAFAIILTSSVFAHPTGNMITIGKQVLWSYINPINDRAHHACVMIWRPGNAPKVWVKSDYPASDFMLYSDQNNIYLIERRHIQTSQKFEIRILKTTINGEPEVIWNWFEDEWRIGEGGFFMVSDNQVVFGKYPKVYSLKKGETPSAYFNFEAPINRIRSLENEQILLLGDSTCWLVEQNGRIINKWTGLLDNQVKNAPLNRNQIFDVDYYNGQLLLAYWGKRSFEIIDRHGKRKAILQQKEPFTPHWVAFLENDKLLFSSELFFNGETPKPKLMRMASNGDAVKIW